MAGTFKFTKTTVTESNCYDDPAAINPTAGGFDSQTGTANGTLQGGGSATIEWTFLDRGPGGHASDRVRLVVKNSGGATVLTVNSQAALALSGTPGGVWTFPPPGGPAA